uniref:MYND-type domain-containing protein n=1 Tax=Glossina brevipalpis TaxID=37001 RepID=A0A1A9WHZ8_9MUSC
MKPHKKKPRQRNRPRNKANRLKNLENPNKSVNEEEIVESNELSCLEQTEQKESLIKGEDTDDDSMPELFDEGNDYLSNTNQSSSSSCKALENLENVLKKNIQKLNNKEENLSEEVETTSKAEFRVKAAFKNTEISTEVNNEQNVFIQNLQHQIESMMANGNEDLPQTIMENLKKMLNQAPISDVETSDDEEEFIEYIYKPRKYFLISLCNLCKCDLCSLNGMVQCSRCHLSYYCSQEHMKNDIEHRQLCFALKQVADDSGEHIFYKCSDFTAEQFRSYRIITIRRVEAVVNRSLTATEQELILFGRLCCYANCREYRFDKLINCSNCGMISYCKEKPQHLFNDHEKWCEAFQLFKQLIIHQEKFGRLEPQLPKKILRDLPSNCCKTKDIYKKLNINLTENNCEYAALTQISTVPLTSWYTLKLCDQLRDNHELTIHLIGAEIDFEVDILHKWELFFLHITPALKRLNVVFIGPELNACNISFDQLKKTKCCRFCRKNKRTVNYYFVAKIYHEYCRTDEFLKPNLICFFNAGLYRSTGYNMEDTWPETILFASQMKVPVVVTAYTEYEMPLDLSRFLQESNRRLNVTLPPHLNPFTSVKPERNFISDDEVPLMFKNYYCFVVE